MICSWLFNKHVYILYLIFFNIFCVQFGYLIKDVVHPTELNTEMVKVSLEDHRPFPLTCKICVRPGYDKEELKKVGYEHCVGYLFGHSRHNKTILGWAGHTENGHTLNVAGKLEITLTYKPQMFTLH